MIEQSTYPRLTEIMKITDTAEGNGCYSLDVKIQFVKDEDPEEVFGYISRPDDPHGINPSIRLWMSQNPDAPVHVYVPKVWTSEEIREAMPNLSSRQFRLGLVASGISPSQIDFIISQMPNGPQKDSAEIEWEYATTFKRTHPLIDTLSASLGLTPEQVDTMWNNAINL